METLSSVGADGLHFVAHFKKGETPVFVKYAYVPWLAETNQFKPNMPLSLFHGIALKHVKAMNCEVKFTYCLSSEINAEKLFEAINNNKADSTTVYIKNLNKKYCVLMESSDRSKVSNGFFLIDVDPSIFGGEQAKAEDLVVTVINIFS